MPDRDMSAERRRPRSGPSDVFSVPEIHPERVGARMAAPPGTSAAGGGVNWENEYKAAVTLDEPEAFQTAIDSAEAAMKAALGDNDINEWKKIKAKRDELKKKLGQKTTGEVGLAEVQRAYEELMNPMRYGTNVKERQNAARRWLGRYRNADGVDSGMVADIENILQEEPGKALEIQPTDEIKVEIRMAMIKELGVSSAGDPGQKCEAFIRQQVNKIGGMGKTHFESNYEKEIRTEYSARAELAGVVNFWDDLAGLMSKSTDVWKEMTEARIDRCIKLSKSTYEWLANGDKETKLRVEGGGVERSSGKEKELRRDMDKVAGAIYSQMILGDLDLWNIRGEDRWARIAQIAEEEGVSIDAVRLTWQLAEAECWQARMGVSFVSHPAAKVVLASRFRNFRTRKLPDAPVPGGSRLWVEWLREHKNVYPSGDDTYDPEGKRLARVGFEAWVIRVSKETAKGENKDPRFGKYRDGVVFLFSETGVIPKPLKEVLGTDLVVTNVGESKTLTVDDDIFQASRGKLIAKISYKDKEKEEREKEKEKDRLDNTLGGERALFAGQYFSKLDALLSQPGLLDLDLPQTIVMTDLSKAAGVFDAIEAFGKIDATKASTDELAKLRNALTSQYFRFQSNDLDQHGGTKTRSIVFGEGTDRERTVNWVTESGVQERMAKARIITGRLMEQWARTYIWLMSWENPNHRSQQTVMGMRDWVLLARDVARSYDESRQWGSYVGYGYGNYDKNELAVLADGKTRRDGPTSEMIRAIRGEGKDYEGFLKWFDGEFYRNRSIVSKKRFGFTVTKERNDKDHHELGEYSQGFIFWRNSWWGRPVQDK